MTLLSIDQPFLPVQLLPENGIPDGLLLQQVDRPVEYFLQGKFQIKIIVGVCGYIHGGEIDHQINITVFIELVGQHRSESIQLVYLVMGAELPDLFDM